VKKLVIGLISFVWCMNACAPAIHATHPSVISNSTTPSSISTATQTSLPIETPTASITPLPTIPTFTPTFDVSTIVTFTPAPKAECPTIDPTVKPEDYLSEKLDYPSSNITNKILEFLNKGGNGQALVERLNQIYFKGDYNGGYAFRDVTGDQVPEFLYVELNYEGKPIVFSCKNRRFELFATLSGEYDFWEYALEMDDLITDGVPEIIVTGTGGVSFPQSTIYLYQWNGRTFSILGQASILALRQTQIKDLDGNRTKEISFSGDNPGCLSCSNFVPQRQKTIIYEWNGKKFVEISNEFTPPEYRFQAVQDADTAVLSGKFDEAFRFYNEAISNEKLEWWSPERLLYEQDASYRWIPGVTPIPEPIADPTEYPRLAAYAYYRIMLLYVVQGNESDAGTVYNTLQEKFGSDQYGSPYVEMATALWKAYQSTHKMYDGCAAAIQYAAEYPEILMPLGSDYHGWQSHLYVPADVCPFR